MFAHVRSSRRCLIAVLLTLGLTAAAACGSSGEKSATADPSGSTTVSADPNDPLAPQPLDKHVTMRVAFVAAGQEPYSPMQLAKEFGEFEKENLSVDFQIVQMQDAAVLLAQDRLDAAPLVLTAGVYNQLATGPDFRMVAGLPWLPATSKAGIWVKKDKLKDDGTMDPCDFKGATVAFGPALKGTTAAVGLLQELQKCDLTLDDINASPLQGPDSVIALKNGAIDAAVVFDPLWSELEESGDGVLVVPLYGKGAVFEGTSPTGWFFGPVRHKNPEAVKALLRAVARTTRDHFTGDYHKNPEMRVALSKVLGVPEETFDSTPTLEADYKLPLDPGVVETMQSAWLKIGLLTYDKPLQTSDVIDDTILKEMFPN